jgi:hypothetical protein
MLPNSRSKSHSQPARSLGELRHGTETLGRAAAKTQSIRRIPSVAKTESARRCPSLTVPSTEPAPSIGSQDAAEGGAEPCAPVQDGRGINCRLAYGGSFASTAKENREKAAQVVRMQLREAFESVTFHFMPLLRMRKPERCVQNSGLVAGALGPFRCMELCDVFHVLYIHMIYMYLIYI